MQAHLKSALFVLFGLALLCSVGVQAQSTPPESVVRAFHEALRTGDAASVKQLLAADVVVVESGRVESREEYLAHHLAADMAFAQAVPSQRLTSATQMNGSTAWVWSTSSSEGRFRDRDIKLQGAELVVLTRVKGAWVIRAIHWSNR